MGRMIYTRIAWNMTDGRETEREGFFYSGPLAWCGGSGGGSSTTNTVDYSYNSRMASLSEEQQKWAREYFGVWQQYQKPYEIAQSQANLAMLPKETELYGRQLDAANSLLPLETEAAKAQLEYGQKSLEAASEFLPKQAEAAGKYMNLALNGVDVNERMGLAAADVSNAWKDARESAARASARMGANPNSGRFQGIMAAADTAQAAQLAGARTQARVGAEQENFQRLSQAAGFNGANSFLAGSQAGKNASNEILQGISHIKG